MVESGEGDVRRNVLDGDLAPQEILDRPDARAHVRQRLLRERKRQEVVEVPPAHAAPAQVLGDECRLDPANQCAELREMLAREGIGRPQRHPDAVQRERIIGPDAIERRERRAAVGEVVLAVNLEPGYRRPRRPARAARAAPAGPRPAATRKGVARHHRRAQFRPGGPAAAGASRLAIKPSAEPTCRPSSRTCPCRRTSTRSDPCRPWRPARRRRASPCRSRSARPWRRRSTFPARSCGVTGPGGAAASVEAAKPRAIAPAIAA